MFEILFDTTNLSTLSTIYATLILSLIIQYIWLWQVEMHYVESVYSSANLTYEQNQISVKRTRLSVCHPIITWIMRFVRLRLEQSDEPNSQLISFTK